jgi:predicted ABC-type sugar transport system permease subunit
MANNGIAVIGYYLLQHEFIKTSPDALGTSENAAILCGISVALTLIGLYFFKSAADKLTTQ